MSNEKMAADLEKVQAADFIAEDLKLFLDTHPNSVKAHRLYCEQVKRAAAIRKDFEEKYGYPLTADRACQCGTGWAWGQNPWTWDKIGG